jgi:nitrite reductase/ring-hydroxylating ferredoxin subunit
VRIREKEQIPMTTSPTTPIPAESTAAEAPSRRRVMKTVGVAGTAAVVGTSVAATSGCSPEEEEAAPTQDASLPSSDVPVGSGTVIDDTYVVTQPKKGEFFAFSSVCTHQGCQVKRVTEEAIICPCHSTNFSVTTGEVLSGPAEEPLPKYEVTEDGGTLTITGK